MKRARFTEEQIISILKQAEAGVRVADLCRQHGFSNATFYTWRSKFGGMNVSDAKRLKQLEEENAWLAAARNRLYHLDLRKVARSTVFDVNNSRFKDLFAEIYGLCTPHAPKHKFRFKSKLFRLDATTIKLCLSIFPWA